MKINALIKPFFPVIFGVVVTICAFKGGNNMAVELRKLFVSPSVIYAFLFFFLLACPFFTLAILFDRKNSVSAEIASWLFDSIFGIALSLATATFTHFVIVTPRQGSSLGVFIIGLVLTMLAWGFKWQVSHIGEAQANGAKKVPWFIKWRFIAIFFVLPLLALIFLCKIPI